MKCEICKKETVKLQLVNDIWICDQHLITNLHTKQKELYKYKS